MRWFGKKEPIHKDFTIAGAAVHMGTSPDGKITLSVHANYIPDRFYAVTALEKALKTRFGHESAVGAEYHRFIMDAKTAKPADIIKMCEELQALPKTEFYDPQRKYRIGDAYIEIYGRKEGPEALVSIESLFPDRFHMSNLLREELQKNNLSFLINLDAAHHAIEFSSHLVELKTGRERPLKFEDVCNACEQLANPQYLQALEAKREAEYKEQNKWRQDQLDKKAKEEISPALAALDAALPEFCRQESIALSQEQIERLKEQIFQKYKQQTQGLGR